MKIASPQVEWMALFTGMAVFEKANSLENIREGLSRIERYLIKDQV